MHGKVILIKKDKCSATAEVSSLLPPIAIASYIKPDLAIAAEEQAKESTLLKERRALKHSEN